MKLFIKILFWLTSTVLLLTAVSKVVGVIGWWSLLRNRDPIVPLLSTRSILLASAAFEIAVASCLVMRRNVQFKLLSIAWISTLFGAYRFALWLRGIDGSCGCSGLQWLQYSKRIQIESVLLWLLVYMFVGSCLGLFFCRKSHEACLKNREA